MTSGFELNICDAQESARDRLRAVSTQVPLEADLSPDEISEAREIAKRLLRYFRVIKNLSDVQIDPRLPGCGPISGGSPDLLALDRSYGADVEVIAEIKTVKRMFRSTDIRQVIIYLTLFFAKYEYTPNVAMIVNPLLGRSIEVGVDDLFELTSGRSARELIPELIFDWSTSGISI